MGHDLPASFLSQTRHTVHAPGLQVSQRCAPGSPRRGVFMQMTHTSSSASAASDTIFFFEPRAGGIGAMA